MSASDDVTGIAARLTDAQREWLDTLHGVVTNPYYPGRQHRACSAMAADGLLTRGEDSVGNTLYRLTPLGLAVRAHLQASASTSQQGD